MPARAPANRLRASKHGGERQLPVLIPLSYKFLYGWGRIDAPFQSTLGKFVVKQAVIRQVKSMSMSCDPVGNLLLAKFSCDGGKDASVFLPASIIFWLLEHIPVNQDPMLQPPPAMPQITQQDWDSPDTARALSVQCKQFADAIRMTFELETRASLMVLLNRSNVELMRQMMENYRPDLMDLDA
jgi:hypothetical protein